MSEPTFIVATDCGRDWPIASFGEDNNGTHWWVTTNRVSASQLHTVSGGAQADAALVCRLLNEQGDIAALRAENKTLRKILSAELVLFDSQVDELVSEWQRKGDAVITHPSDVGIWTD